MDYAVTDSKTEDKNLTTYLNLSIPFKIGELIKGMSNSEACTGKKTGSGMTGRHRQFESSVNVIGPNFYPIQLDLVTLNDDINISAVGLGVRKGK